MISKELRWPLFPTTDHCSNIPIHRGAKPRLRDSLLIDHCSL